MTTHRVRALLRDCAVRAALLTPIGRRYLTEMRFRPQPVHRSGLVYGRHPLVGRPLPQPRVLIAPSMRPGMLDEVLGTGWALLGVNVTEPDWARSQDQLWAAMWNGPPPELGRVDVVLGDRLPRAVDTRHAVADLDGRLDAALCCARNLFILLRPDRYVAAVVGPDDESTAAAQFSGQLASQPSTDDVPHAEEGATT